MIRFTVWLNDTERDALRAKADEHGASQNYIARIALRQFLGIRRPGGKEEQSPADAPKNA